jgi:acyl carrier protein
MSSTQNLQSTLRLEDLVSALQAEIAGLSEGKFRAEEIDPDGHLFDWGYVSSLSAVTFIAHVEERWGVVIEDIELLEELTTLNAVATRIQRDA